MSCTMFASLAERTAHREQLRSTSIPSGYLFVRMAGAQKRHKWCVVRSTIPFWSTPIPATALVPPLPLLLGCLALALRQVSLSVTSLVPRRPATVPVRSWMSPALVGKRQWDKDACVWNFLCYRACEMSTLLGGYLFFKLASIWWPVLIIATRCLISV